MAAGTLTPAGKVKLQEVFAGIAKELYLEGTQTEFGVGTIPLNISLQNGLINWEAADATNGLKLSGIESYNVSCTTTRTPMVVQGIEIKNGQKQTLLIQDFPLAQQATYTFADDGSTGRYTVSEITINFS